MVGTGTQLAKPEIATLEFTTTTGDKGTLPVAFVADGLGKIKPVSLLEFLSGAEAKAEAKRLAAAHGPDRRKGTAIHHTLGSFLQHVERFKDEGTAIWINRDAADENGENVARLVAIFNYHQPTAAGPARWGDHKATYDMQTSEAWDAWGGGQERVFGAEGLAEFLEARDYELAQGTLQSGTNAPPPSFLLTMADKLEVNSATSMRKERDSADGPGEGDLHRREECHAGGCRTAERLLDLHQGVPGQRRARDDGGAAARHRPGQEGRLQDLDPQRAERLREGDG